MLPNRNKYLVAEIKISFINPIPSDSLDQNVKSRGENRVKKYSQKSEVVNWSSQGQNMAESSYDDDASI